MDEVKEDETKCIRCLYLGKSYDGREPCHRCIKEGWSDGGRDGCAYRRKEVLKETHSTKPYVLTKDKSHLRSD